MSKEEIKYDLIACIAKSETTTTFIGKLKKFQNSSKLFLINQISKNNKKLLTDLFTFANSQNGKSFFEDFFIHGEFFYIVSDYHHAESIQEKLREEKNVYTLEERLEMAETIAIRLNSLSYLPINIRLCLLEPSNICIDLKNDIKINYNLLNISSYENCSDKDLFKSLAKVLEIIFEHEIKFLKNQNIKLVIEKCNFNLYDSIAELVVDLKKSTLKKNKNNFILKIKYLCQKYKSQLKRVSIATLCIASVSLCCFAVVTILNKQPTGINFTIGDVEYNAALNDSKDNTIKIEKQTSDGSGDIVMDLSIPPEVELDFEDYILKPTDTIQSICNANYSNENFISTIKSYNKLSGDEDLKAGSIIKLPNETMVKDYFSI